jgi:hypothetical protein
VTGGNGIAGMSASLVKEYAHGSGGRNGDFFRGKWGWSLSGFHYSGMVLPEIIWSVSEKLYGQNVAASEDQKTGGSGTEIDYRP